MNFAVIGSFWLTDHMIDAIKSTDSASYFAQYSRSQERAKEYSLLHGDQIRIYNDLHQMAQDTDIDAVYIASPNYAHYDQAKTMLEAGKSVLCEKPVCYTRKQYEELCRIADSRNVVFMEAMMNVHLPVVENLKQKLESLGNVVSARLDFSQRSSKLDRALCGDFASTFRPENGGGALMDLGVYLLYFAYNLFGIPSQIEAKANFFSSGVDITDTILLDYGSFCVVLTLSKRVESQIRSEILCEKGSVCLQNLSRLENVIVHQGGISEKISGECDFVTAMRYELSDFISYHHHRHSKEEIRCRELACAVLDGMEDIRNKIGYLLPD